MGILKSKLSKKQSNDVSHEPIPDVPHEGIQQERDADIPHAWYTVEGSSVSTPLSALSLYQVEGSSVSTPLSALSLYQVEGSSVSTPLSALSLYQRDADIFQDEYTRAVIADSGCDEDSTIINYARSRSLQFQDDYTIDEYERPKGRDLPSKRSEIGLLAPVSEYDEKSDIIRQPRKGSDIRQPSKRSEIGLQIPVSEYVRESDIIMHADSPDQDVYTIDDSSSYARSRSLQFQDDYTIDAYEVLEGARNPTRGISPVFDDGDDDQRNLLNILPGEGSSFDIPYRWSECIKQKDDKIAAALVKRRVLPSNSELHKACHVFGKQSVTFSNMCDTICKQTMTTSKNIVDVWASYLAEKYHSDGKIHIVFIAITTDISKSIKLTDYQYHSIKENTFSNESDVVLANELADETSDISSTRETVENMRKCVARHAENLLEKHSNISVILPSLKKSVGYKSPNHIILDEPCIVLFICVKGYIPINEDPFPQKIDGFKVDVLEGKFESYGGGPNEFHEHLKMGLAIHANIRDSNNHLLGGTLGGFVNHPKYNMCGITCAHVVCSSEEMSSVKFCGLRDGFNKPLFQPVNKQSVSFGRVVMAVYKEGDEHFSGMEVALFEIQKRHPKDGSFPMAFNNIPAGFDENNPMTYNSGDVCESLVIKRRTEVYKYGITTGITRGSFALKGAVVRKDRMEGKTQSFGYSLKNQLVVLQIGDDPFAKAGDSGALVLMEGFQSDSAAIGIVEGGMNGRVFVTPICDILRAFGCTDIKMHTFNTDVNGSVSTGSGVDMKVSEPMDVND